MVKQNYIYISSFIKQRRTEICEEIVEDGEHHLPCNKLENTNFYKNSTTGSTYPNICNPHFMMLCLVSSRWPASCQRLAKKPERGNDETSE